MDNDDLEPKTKQERKSELTELVEAIQEFRYDPKKLDINQRREIVAYLKVEKSCSGGQIADILNVNRQTVHRDLKVIWKRYQKDAESYNVPSMIGRLALECDYAKNQARKNKDYNSVWRIQCEFIVMLQKLGWIPEAPKRIVIEEGESPRTKEDVIRSIVRLFADGRDDNDEVPELEGMGLLPNPSDEVDPEVL